IFVVAGLISAPAAFYVVLGSGFIAHGLSSGAAVLIGAFYLLFFPQPSFPRWVMKTGLWSCVGGALAMAGLAMEIDPNHSVKFAVVTWQTGMGALLGALMWWERRGVG